MQSGVGDERDRLVDQGCDAEVLSESGGCGSGDVVVAGESSDDSADGAFARASWPDEQEHLLKVRVADEEIAEDLLQGVSGLAVVGPEVVEELEPPSRWACVGYIVERNRVMHVEQRGVRDQFAGRHVE